MTESTFARQGWDQRFSAPDYVFGSEPNAFLKAHAHRLGPGQSVLAVADGEGRNGVFLAGLGLDVLSVDFSAPGLAKAKALAEQKRVTMRFEQADLTAWTWPEDRFDAVAAIFIQFANPDERAAIFSGMKRAVKPGGLILMEGYRPEQLVYKTGGPPFADYLYTRGLLESAFADWQIVELREHDSAINEGAGHAGMSALIDLVAKKPLS